MVQDQQPAPHHLRDQRTHHRLQEKENRDPTIDHQQGLCGEGGRRGEPILEGENL